MLRYIQDYKNPEEDNINFDIMNDTLEKEMYEYVIDAFSSIEYVLPEIHLEDIRFTVEANESDYVKSRNSNKKDQKKIVYTKESLVGELYMNFKVDLSKVENEYDFDFKYKSKSFTVKLLIPITDDNGYYVLQGKRYLMQYQLSERSTYTTSNTVNVKSVSPIRVQKRIIELKDTDGSRYFVSYYKIMLFKSYENYIIFYLAKMGWSNTLVYYGVERYIKAVTQEEYDPKFIHFKISNSLFIKADKKAFEASGYIRSIVGNIMELLTNRISYEDLNNRRIWIEKIGSIKQNTTKDAHYRLGKRYLMLINRMLDKSSQESYHLTNYNSKNIYRIIRWVIQNFNYIKAKDNLDILNKRLRKRECIGNSINSNISKKIKKFINTSPNNFDKLIEAYEMLFSFRGNEIIIGIHYSGLLRSDNIVNDGDFFQKFRVTQKGPNSSGNNVNSKTVTAEQRSIHPSHIGILDLNVCSASEPGLTNYICPASPKLDGLCFKDSAKEPENFFINFYKEIHNDIDDITKGDIAIIDPIKYNNVLEVISECCICKRDKNLDEDENYEEYI